MFIAMFPWFEYLNDMLKRALFTMVLFPWTVLHADTFHVDILANGQTWKDAFPDLQQALALANLWKGSGIYFSGIYFSSS